MTKDTKIKDIFIFIIGLLSCIPIRIVGTFYVGEIVVFIFTFFGGCKSRPSFPDRKFIVLTLLWLLGSIISNVINHSPGEDSFKGVFNIIFFIAQVPFVHWAIYDKPSRWLCFVIGAGISSIFSFYLFRYVDELVDFEYYVWRLYAWYPFAIAISALLYYKNKYFLSYLLALAFGVYALFQGSRNVFLTMTIAVLTLAFIGRFKDEDYHTAMNYYMSRGGKFLIVLLFGLSAIYVTYRSLAENHILGESAYDKYIDQSSSKMGLTSGRGDFILALEFIARNPIFGYGSYASDKNHLRPLLSEKYGLEYSYRLESGYGGSVVPCHSIILGQWAWHGILAGLFWMYVLLLIIKTMKCGYYLREKNIMGLCVLCMMQQLWDILFSPMGQRTPLLFLLIFLLIIKDN